ncbi:hypothetical protein [Photorhabdus heterorhabditis]|uniref:hypothetical protein n=1 Tax=Photorhabdus heterorhabditis TaxID=880156 RepID=UPI00128C9600|nr:hypothetical protein [Photorhabdus heterorhabditis]
MVIVGIEPTLPNKERAACYLARHMWPDLANSHGILRREVSIWPKFACLANHVKGSRFAPFLIPLVDTLCGAFSPQRLCARLRLAHGTTP